MPKVYSGLDPDSLEAVVGGSSCSPEMQVAVAQDPDLRRLHYVLAGNPNLCQEALDVLVAGGLGFVLARLLRAGHDSAELLQAAARSGNAAARAGAAALLDDMGLLRVLAVDPFLNVRRAVAANVSADEDIRVLAALQAGVD